VGQHGQQVGTRSKCIRYLCDANMLGFQRWASQRTAQNKASTMYFPLSACVWAAVAPSCCFTLCKAVHNLPLLHKHCAYGNLYCLHTVCRTIICTFLAHLQRLLTIACRMLLVGLALAATVLGQVLVLVGVALLRRTQRFADLTHHDSSSWWRDSQSCQAQRLQVRDITGR
jgi:hypothetical protein